MEPDGVPALVEALFIYNKAEIMLDKRAKASLRLCNKHFKNLIDATVAEAEIHSDDLNDDLKALINTEWQDLALLHIQENSSCPSRLTELPSALFVKFSRLETLEIYNCMSLKALPEDIGELSHLKVLEMLSCESLSALPSSLGQLTALETISLRCCYSLTAAALAPLQHLTGLISLRASLYGRDKKYPDFFWNLTSLKELWLFSESIKTLPAAFGNLTNLESLVLGLRKLKELPESIGNLNVLKYLRVGSTKLTTLPESLDDLLWRKAHETEESKKMEIIKFHDCYKLVLSPKMKQALELLEQDEANIIWPWDRHY